MINFGWIAAGVAIGTIGVLLSTPLPAVRGDCAVYSVAHKVATAYVLRPPPSPALDPVIVKEKCPTPAAEIVSEQAETKTEEKPLRHRRHHRRRAYWR